ncbi:uncharacterized protein isoform X1 [Choristoneura fumiferana]|uniref:uncharacterized protein isoform X1 n=2 Tax=Choristoneura fumiferana TaxID=7141 RepID=UPI003D157D9D
MIQQQLSLNQFNPIGNKPLSCDEMAYPRALYLILAAALVPLCLAETASPALESTMPNFPEEEEDNSRYKTLEANATLLKLLVNGNNGVSRSEVFDMLHSRDDNEQHDDLPSFPEDLEDVREDVASTPDQQAELLQGSRPVLKDSPRQIAGAEPIGTAAGIMILITCSLACLAYTALIIWRRKYLKENGLKHELLRNEDMNIAETRIEL